MNPSEWINPRQIIPEGVNARDWLEFSRQNRTHYHRLALEVLEKFTPRPGDEILEVGCGAGFLCRELISRGPAGLGVTGVDTDPEMIRLAGRENRDGSPAPAFRTSHQKNPDFGTSRFDLIISEFSLHHWEYPAGTLKALVTACRPGGRIFIRDINPGSLLAWLLGTPFLEKRAHGGRAHIRRAFQISRQNALSIREVKALVKLVDLADRAKIQPRSYFYDLFLFPGTGKNSGHKAAGIPG